MNSNDIDPFVNGSVMGAILASALLFLIWHIARGRLYERLVSRLRAEVSKARDFTDKHETALQEAREREKKETAALQSAVSAVERLTTGLWHPDIDKTADAGINARLEKAATQVPIDEKRLKSILEDALASASGAYPTLKARLDYHWTRICAVQKFIAEKGGELIKEARELRQIIAEGQAMLALWKEEEKGEKDKPPQSLPVVEAVRIAVRRGAAGVQICAEVLIAGQWKLGDWIYTDSGFVQQVRSGTPSYVCGSKPVEVIAQHAPIEEKA